MPLAHLAPQGGEKSTIDSPRKGKQHTCFEKLIMASPGLIPSVCELFAVKLLEMMLY